MKRMIVALAALALVGCGDMGAPEKESGGPETYLRGGGFPTGGADLRASGSPVVLWSELREEADGTFRFDVFARDYTGTAGEGTATPRPGILDAFGLDWFHGDGWEPTVLEFGPDFGTAWGDGPPDPEMWQNFGIFYPNQYVSHGGGRAGAIHAPGDWRWSDHYGDGEACLILSVTYLEGWGAAPRLAPGPYEGSGTWGPAGDFEGGRVLPNRATTGAPCGMGSLSMTRSGDVITLRAWANDPFEEPHGFEANALMLDWELPAGLDVLGLEFGWPVSTWERSSWRQYTHPQSGETRLVVLAASGQAGTEIEPGQRYVFCRMQVDGPGFPIPHHPLADNGLVDGFTGYAICGR